MKIFIQKNQKLKYEFSLEEERKLAEEAQSDGPKGMILDYLSETADVYNEKGELLQKDIRDKIEGGGKDGQKIYI